MKCGITSLSLFKIDRILSFDVRHSMFDIRFFRVSIFDHTARSATSGWADTRNLAPLYRAFVFRETSPG